MNSYDVGRFISELRKEKEMTQKDLAEKLNVTDKAVSKWETGRSVPDVSLLIDLSEILGVTVIELLKGEKIRTERFPEVGDKVVVETIREDKRKIKCAALIAAIVMFILSCIVIFSYPAYHVFTSVPIDNEKAILRQSERYFEESEEKIKIIRTVKKGDYFFYLLQGESSMAVRVFEKDDIFDNRISFMGGGGCSKPDEIALYASSQDNNTINVFYGYDMTAAEYRYIYRGVHCVKPIEDGIVFDVLVDIDDTSSHPDIIYEE